MSDPKPEIVLLGPSSELYKGGIAQFTSFLADELNSSVILHFFSWYQLYPPFLISREFRDKVSRRPVGTSCASFVLGYMNPFSWIRFAFRVREINPDMVVFTWSHAVHAPVYAFLNLCVRLFTKAELVYICHNILPHEGFLGARWLTKTAFRGAKRLVVHGRSEALRAAELMADKNVTRLFLPIHDFFGSKSNEAASNPGHSRRLLFFGNVRRYKGLDVLLRALAIVRQRYPDVHLKVAGEQFYESKAHEGGRVNGSEDIFSLIDELQLHDSVDLDLRYIPNEEISSLFADRDLVVFPFRAATQSGSLTVAYAYAKPVIATRVGGLPDVVLEGKSGYLADPGSPESLADAIIKFFENPITAEQVKEVAQKLSWKRYVQGLINGRDFLISE